MLELRVLASFLESGSGDLLQASVCLSKLARKLSQLKAKCTALFFQGVHELIELLQLHTERASLLFGGPYADKIQQAFALLRDALATSPPLPRCVRCTALEACIFVIFFTAVALMYMYTCIQRTMKHTHDTNRGSNSPRTSDCNPAIPIPFPAGFQPLPFPNTQSHSHIHAHTLPSPVPIPPAPPSYDDDTMDMADHYAATITASTAVAQVQVQQGGAAGGPLSASSLLNDLAALTSTFVGMSMG